MNNVIEECKNTIIRELDKLGECTNPDHRYPALDPWMDIVITKDADTYVIGTFVLRLCEKCDKTYVDKTTVITYTEEHSLLF